VVERVAQRASVAVLVVPLAAAEVAETPPRVAVALDEPC
jgi:hypothetical protein